MLPLVFVSFLLALSNVSHGYESGKGGVKRGSLFEREAPSTCSCSDSPSTDFQKKDTFEEAASAAPEPLSYVNVFTNGHSWPTGAGWLGYTNLDEYNATICAALCDASESCSSFAIYFEKTDSDPSSTEVKCAFWVGALVSSDSSSNAEIAGCNGYNKASISPPEDFGTPSYAGNATVHPAPGTAAGDSFIDTTVFDGPFDINKCADECSKRECKFFSTYMVTKDGKDLGQFCDLYAINLSSDASGDSELSEGKDGYNISRSFTCPYLGRGPQRPSPSAGSKSTSTTKGSSTATPTATYGDWNEHHPWCTSRPAQSTTSSKTTTSSQPSTTTSEDGQHTTTTPRSTVSPTSRPTWSSSPSKSSTMPPASSSPSPISTTYSHPTSSRPTPPWEHSTSSQTSTTTRDPKTATSSTVESPTTSTTTSSYSHSHPTTTTTSTATTSTTTSTSTTTKHPEYSSSTTTTTTTTTTTPDYSSTTSSDHTSSTTTTTTTTTPEDASTTSTTAPEHSSTTTTTTHPEYSSTTTTTTHPEHSSTTTSTTTYDHTTTTTSEPTSSSTTTSWEYSSTTTTPVYDTTTTSMTSSPFSTPTWTHPGSNSSNDSIPYYPPHNGTWLDWNSTFPNGSYPALPNGTHWTDWLNNITFPTNSTGGFNFSHPTNSSTPEPTTTPEIQEEEPEPEPEIPASNTSHPVNGSFPSFNSSLPGNLTHWWLDWNNTNANGSYPALPNGTHWTDWLSNSTFPGLNGTLPFNASHPTNSTTPDPAPTPEDPEEDPEEEPEEEPETPSSPINGTFPTHNGTSNFTVPSFPGNLTQWPGANGTWPELPNGTHWTDWLVNGTFNYTIPHNSSVPTNSTVPVEEPVEEEPEEEDPAEEEPEVEEPSTPESPPLNGTSPVHNGTSNFTVPGFPFNGSLPGVNGTWPTLPNGTHWTDWLVNGTFNHTIPGNFSQPTNTTLPEVEEPEQEESEVEEPEEEEPEVEEPETEVPSTADPVLNGTFPTHNSTMNFTIPSFPLNGSWPELPNGTHWTDWLVNGTFNFTIPSNSSFPTNATLPTTEEPETPEVEEPSEEEPTEEEPFTPSPHLNGTANFTIPTFPVNGSWPELPNGTHWTDWLSNSTLNFTIPGGFPPHLNETGNFTIPGNFTLPTNGTLPETEEPEVLEEEELPSEEEPEPETPESEEPIPETSAPNATVPSFPVNGTFPINGTFPSFPVNGSWPELPNGTHWTDWLVNSTVNFTIPGGFPPHLNETGNFTIPELPNNGTVPTPEEEAPEEETPEEETPEETSPETEPPIAESNSTAPTSNFTIPTSNFTVPPSFNSTIPPTFNFTEGGPWPDLPNGTHWTDWLINGTAPLNFTIPAGVNPHSNGTSTGGGNFTIPGIAPPAAPPVTEGEEAGEGEETESGNGDETETEIEGAPHTPPTSLPPSQGPPYSNSTTGAPPPAGEQPETQGEGGSGSGEGSGEETNTEVIDKRSVPPGTGGIEMRRRGREKKFAAVVEGL